VQRGQAYTPSGAPLCGVVASSTAILPKERLVFPHSLFMHKPCLSGVTSAINIIFTGFGMLFVSVYLLSDTRKLKAAYLKVAPHRYRSDAAVLWGEFGFSLSCYVAGLFVVILVQGAVSTIALSTIGIPYPFVLGAWVSATAILPYIGAWLGAIPAVAIAAFISPTKAALVVLAYIGIQQLEGNLLTPRIQGQALRVHPILVFLAVIIGTEIAGLTGALFAVPTARGRVASVIVPEEQNSPPAP